jgi:hypothetical protein
VSGFTLYCWAIMLTMYLAFATALLCELHVCVVQWLADCASPDCEELA